MEGTASIVFTPHPVEHQFIGFEHESHTYRLCARQEEQEWRDSLVEFVSGTQFAEHYMPKFDSDFLSKKAAANKGVPVAEILKEWETNKNLACEMGTRVHAGQEAMMNGEQPLMDYQTEREKAIMESGRSAIENIILGGWKPVQAEKVIFSLKYKIAGTVDALFSRGREYMIVDWKTNKEIRKKNQYNQRCNPPILHLDACEYTKYQIQLSLYKKILLAECYLNAIAPVRLCIVHLKPDGFVPIPVEDMPELDTLILDYLTTWRHGIDEKYLPF